MIRQVLFVCVVIGLSSCAFSRELTSFTGGSSAGPTGPPNSFSGGSSVTGGSSVQAAENASNPTQQPGIPAEMGAECARKAEAMGIPAFVAALLPCIQDQQSETCCNALTNLFGPDEDESSDLEFCLCDSGYITSLKENLAAVPFITLETVLNTFSYCGVPHAVNETTLLNCEMPSPMP